MAVKAGESQIDEVGGAAVLFPDDMIGLAGAH